MTYPLYYMGKKVRNERTVRFDARPLRDRKGKFKAPTLSPRAWRTIATLLILPCLWAVGYFFHIVWIPMAHAQPKMVDVHGMVDTCYYVKYHSWKIPNLAEMIEECGKIGIKI